LTILGTGLTSALGRPFAGSSIDTSFTPLPIPGLSQLPLLGESLFSLNVLAYFSLVLIAFIGWGLSRSRLGLKIKAVGESPAVARSLGLPVTRIRYGAVLFGGAMSGLAGSYYALAQFKMWQDNLTSGNGWIALALVVFATWRVTRVAAGALLFGGVTALGLYFQAINVKVSVFALSSLPYVATVIVLVLLSRNPHQIRRHAPAWLGKPYFDNA
jgi:simple sugar transport system permease protein